MEWQPDDKKLAEAILYISKKSEGDESFGATKLNKLLFYSDFMAFGKLGEPITGQDYQKLEHGPAPRHLLPIQNALVQERAIRVEPVEYHGDSARHRTCR